VIFHSYVKLPEGNNYDGIVVLPMCYDNVR
jgi:hypothetical protein